MATSLTLENDSSLAQGYIKVNGSTAATLTTSGITANLTGNVTGTASNVANGAITAAKLDGGQTGSAPIYGCRAWVNFDGTRDTTGAVSTANTNRLIRASGNVSSVLRLSTGRYQINFSNAISDTSYSVCATAAVDGIWGSTGQYKIAGTEQQSSMLTTSTIIGVYAGQASMADSSIITAQIFR